MQLHLDSYPKFISFEENSTIFLTKKELFKLFSDLDKDRQIEALLNNLKIKSSDIVLGSYCRDVYLFWKKVGFFAYLLEEHCIQIQILESSNLAFWDYDFSDYDMQYFRLDKVNVPYLGQAILYHIILFSKSLWKEKLKLVSSNYAYRKWFYDDVFDYFERKNIIKKSVNYGRKYLVRL